MLRAKLLQLLGEKPRTLEELARLTGHPVPTVKWHLIGLPIREKQHNGTTLIFLILDARSNNYENIKYSPQGDAGYGYVKCDAKTSLSDFISPNECEVKTPQRPQIAKRSRKDRVYIKVKYPYPNLHLLYPPGVQYPYPGYH